MRIDPRALLKLPLPTLVLGLVAGGILLALVALILGGTRAAELLATPAKAAAALEIDLANAPSPPDLGAIQSQPLMYATRTYFQAPTPSGEPVAPPLPDYRLAGVFIVPNKTAVALLDSGAGATRRVRMGEDLDGWKVQAIEARRVVLQWNEQQKVIGAQPAALNAGLRRVPMQRQRIASSGGVQTLGSPMSPADVPPGSSSPVSGMGGPAVDVPRLYSPPPSN